MRSTAGVVGYGWDDLRRFRGVVMAFATAVSMQIPPAVAKEVSGALSARPAATPVATMAPGRHRLRAGAAATLYVPQSIPAGASAPLLLLLHGGGGRSGDMIRRFKAQADTRGIVLLAPDSADRTWDVAMAMLGNPAAPPSFGKDVRRLDALLMETFERVKVDPQYLAVAGFSDGASMALSIGANNAALFPATLAFSAGGMVPEWSGRAGRVFLSHGEKDRILPLATMRDAWAPALRATGFAVTFVSFDGGHAIPDPVLEQAMVWWLGR